MKIDGLRCLRWFLTLDHLKGIFRLPFVSNFLTGDGTELPTKSLLNIEDRRSVRRLKKQYKKFSRPIE